MTKKLLSIGSILLMLFSLGGCTAIGNKSATIPTVYMVTSIFAFVLLVLYLFLIKKKEPWFLLLFSAVTVVNLGYMLLSLSQNLEAALMANRISYLGSVFLPLSMLMAINRICNIKYPKWAIFLLLGISTIVFLIAASPGYLDIYYKEVSIISVSGATTLVKDYGPLHSLYLYYLLGYFATMLLTIILARKKQKIKTSTHATLILFAVLVNIGVWLMEQLVEFQFEFLSVSYIVSELFLLGISLLVNDIDFYNSTSPATDAQQQTESLSSAKTTLHSNNAETLYENSVQEKLNYLLSSLHTLTPTEKEVYRLYIEGKKTKEVMAALNITENTLKYHNRNIYSKLGVANRKELIDLALKINNT